ncbi:unnamed protein product [Rhizoctonia solani]|uniref:Ubiquitin-like domain-containing protein n=1 Tax=Rhizoctonia solani TaxID=456999 RepID=A0A8H3DF53_9AGAM|nr:unnamed protein product [Rhizoctonia solani]
MFQLVTILVLVDTDIQCSFGGDASSNPGRPSPDRDTKIKEVKQLYKDTTGVYPDILEYHDNALQDDRTLGEYGVEEYGDPIIVKGALLIAIDPLRFR